ncbi:MAG: glycosyltransferase [Pseudomonadales bacterium]
MAVTTIFIQGRPDTDVVRGVGGEKVLFLEQPGENLRGIKFSQIFRLAKLLADVEYEVVIAHRYKAIYLAGIMSYFRDFKVMLGVAHEHRVFQRITRKLFVTFWRRKFLVAGVSASVVNDIAERCPSLLSEDRLFHLPNALRLDHQNNIRSRQDARVELGVAEDEFVVGFIGRLVKKKSLPVLIAGFARFAASHAKAKLHLLGSGPMEAELRSQVAKLGIDHRVKFHGHVPEAGLLVKAMDLLVLPSGKAEAFGLVLLEAMIAKVPVLSSTAPGPAEVHGDANWQFAEADEVSLANKLRQWYELDADARATVVAQNYQRAIEQFAAEKFQLKLQRVIAVH